MLLNNQGVLTLVTQGRGEGAFQGFLETPFQLKCTIIDYTYPYHNL